MVLAYIITNVVAFPSKSVFGRNQITFDVTFVVNTPRSGDFIFFRLFENGNRIHTSTTFFSARQNGTKTFHITVSSSDYNADQIEVFIADSGVLFNPTKISNTFTSNVKFVTVGTLQSDISQLEQMILERNLLIAEIQDRIILLQSQIA